MQTTPLDRTEEDDQDNPALSNVIERNIRTIIQLRLKDACERSSQDRVADAITSFSGSMVFVYLHAAWFTAWVLLNTGRFGVPPFDPFPYGLLTMVVSLEAIFLSTLVLITQNRLSEEVEKRADLEMETRPENVLAEIARLQRLAQLNGPPAPKTISGRTTL